LPFGWRLEARYACRHGVADLRRIEATKLFDSRYSISHLFSETWIINLLLSHGGERF
jgi:hypothetical protein